MRILKNATRSGQRMRILKELTTAKDGWTDDDLQLILDIDGNSERPRRGELYVADYVKANGKLRKTRAGGMAKVWVITPKGRKVVARG